MTETNSAYFRQRARYHWLQAKSGEQDVACIHRRFAQLYVAKAMKAERMARIRRLERRLAPPMLAPMIGSAPRLNH